MRFELLTIKSWVALFFIGSKQWLHDGFSPWTFGLCTEREGGGGRVRRRMKREGEGNSNFFCLLDLETTVPVSEKAVCRWQIIEGWNCIWHQMENLISERYLLEIDAAFYLTWPVKNNILFYVTLFRSELLHVILKVSSYHWLHMLNTKYFIQNWKFVKERQKQKEKKRIK